MIAGRRYIKSSSFFMALLFTVLCGAAALSLGYFINYFARGHFIQNTGAVIDSEIRYIEALGTREDLPENHQRFYLPLDRDGKLPDAVRQKMSFLREGILVFTPPGGERRYAAKIHRFADGQNILIGYDITAIVQDFRFMQWLGAISIVFVMIVVFVSYLISVFVVNGTNKIANTAKEIMETGDLSRRVDIGSRWDDLGNMTTTLNFLLARIEQLMTGVRQVSDNIAHDLRTPLTRLRNRIEDLHDNENSAQARDDLLKEADHLLSTFNALLRISRIETEKQRSRFQPLDIRDVLQDVIEFYEPLAEEKAIRLDARLDSAPFNGDRDLLFQAFANIIDNAIKHTPAAGTIFFSLYRADDRIHIDISDSGPGVADKDLGRIFERFYRAEESRNTAGTGLGLSLVAAIVNLHHGHIAARNTGTGLQIITIL